MKHDDEWKDFLETGYLMNVVDYAIEESEYCHFDVEDSVIDEL